MVRCVATFMVAAMLAPLAGCIQGVDTHSSGADEGPWFSFAQPEWKPGFEWSFLADDYAPYKFEVASMAVLDGRLGAVGISSEEHTYPWPDFFRPGFQQPARLHANGNIFDRCAMPLVEQHIRYYTSDGKVREPLVQFPLEPGKTWRPDPWSYYSGPIILIMEFTVVGLEPISVSAGTFEAARIEVFAWYEADDKKRADYLRKVGEDEKTQKALGPVAVFHYAPDAQAVVRLDVPGPRHPSVGMAFDGLYGPHQPGADNRTVIELVSFSLDEKAPLTEWEIMDAVNNGYCTTSQSLLTPAPPPPPPPSLMLSPALTILDELSDLEWHVQTQNAPEEHRIEWELRAGHVAGPLVSSGAGESFAHAFDQPGGYVIEATIIDQDGHAVALARGAVVINQSITATIACLATADASWLSPIIPEADDAQVGGCEPFSFPVGPGHAAVDAVVEGRPGDAMVPYAYLALLDPNGVEVRRTSSDEMSGAHLTANVGFEAEGNWTLEWHPAFTVASEATIQLSVQYWTPFH